VTMPENTMAPSASGNQPPSSILCIAAAKNGTVDQHEKGRWKHA
jgi:hypothetical protein